MKRLGLFLIAPLFATACAARQPVPTNELIAARQAFAQASQGNAAVEAPKSLRVARATLTAAEDAHRDNPGSQREKELAYMALRRAQAAIAEGNALAARRDAEAARNDLRVTSEQAARALEKARADAQAAQAQADAEAQQRQAAEQDAANVRMSLEQIEAALADVRRQLTAQGTTIDEQTRKLKERESALQAQVDAMRAERDKAKLDSSQAQAERDQALAAMRRLGDVAEQSDKSLVLTLGSEVMFRSRQAALLPRAKEKLDRLAEALQTLGSEQTFVVEGHTDSKGSAASNERLSRLRALAVRSYLIKRGVDPDRIRAEGRGEDEPVASNRDAEGRANNRRVEIVVTPPTVSRR